ncbi:hypothetical protein [Phenylobacterium sp.]|jgi:hypothetical protein|uniref:hypothetical protein n=1 Tax=Phenylobacterium sp. TaxID=1871053 RepID=UPI002F95BA7E
MMPRLPRDPLISRHPAPLTARQARDEVRHAGKMLRRVPAAHPYGILPLWTPYPVARLVSVIVERWRPTVRPAILVRPPAAPVKRRRSAVSRRKTPA